MISNLKGSIFSFLLSRASGPRCISAIEIKAIKKGLRTRRARIRRQLTLTLLNVNSLLKNELVAKFPPPLQKSLKISKGIPVKRHSG